MTLQLVGTSVPFSVQGRQFLLTAKHVLEWHGADELLYPTDREGRDIVGVSGDYVGVSKATVPDPSGLDNADLAVLELPPENLSSAYSSVPRYMVAGSITLKHVDKISLIGYPVTRNKYRPRSRNNVLKSVALEIPHEITSYDALGLNPVTHFCAKFNHKEMKGPDGRGFRPLNPSGLSGGPAWNVTETARRTGTDEGASLLGIVSEYDPKHNVIWGPRLSYAFLSLADAFPELASSFKLQGKQRTFDPEEARYFRRATGNV
jgi:hypothetical protein